MRVISILLVYVLIFSQTTFAGDCPEDVQVIEKGQIANCSGVLLSPEASKKVDETQEDAKYYKTLSDKLQLRYDYMGKEVNLLDQRLKLYVDQSEVLAREVHRKESEDKWQKFIYFGLGVFATGIAVYSVSKIDR